MAYIIKIQEITTETHKHKEWVRLQADDPKMGYSPETDREVSVEREIYSQRVEVLDLASVVKAINKL